jgi:hypothetical protein
MEESPCQKSAYNIDQLTLELLVNKQKYKSYLAKNDQSQFEKLQQKQSSYQRHMNKIEHMTQQLFSNYMYPKSKFVVSKKIQDIFDAYIDECICHFDRQQELEREIHNEDNFEKEETLFEYCDIEAPPETSSSKNVLPYYTMDMFMKSK